MTKTQIVGIVLLFIYSRIADGGEDGLDYWVRDPKLFHPPIQRRDLDSDSLVPLNLNESMSENKNLFTKKHKHHRSHHLKSSPNLEAGSPLGNRDGTFEEDPENGNTNIQNTHKPKSKSHAPLWVTTPGLPRSSIKDIDIPRLRGYDSEPRGVQYHKYNKLYDIPGYNDLRNTQSHYVSKEHLFGWTNREDTVLPSSKKHDKNPLNSGAQLPDTTYPTIKELERVRHKGTDEGGIRDQNAKQRNEENTKKYLRGDKNNEHKPRVRHKPTYQPIKSYKVPEHFLRANEQKSDRASALVKAVSDTLDPYNINKHFSQEKLECEFPEATFDVTVIGKTISRNDILLLKIKEKDSDLSRHFRAENKYAEEAPEKKTIFIVHGLSAIGIHKVPALSKVKEFYKLLKAYTRHIQDFDFYVIPNANPDGFQASDPGGPGKYGKEWNKNQSPQEICVGVAVDRNFDVGWNETKQVSACNQQYPGPYPFSEPESEAVRGVIHRYSSKLIAYINVHAATYDPSEYKGDAILYPKGYTDVASDDDKYIDLRGEIEEAMSNAGFRILQFTVDTLHNWYHKAAGTSVDYAAVIYGIPYSMEFVMQSYENYTCDAFTEVWERVINVTFTNIYNHLTKTTVAG